MHTPSLLFLAGITAVSGLSMYFMLQVPKIGDRVIYTDKVGSHIATLLNYLPDGKAEIIIENMYIIVDRKQLIKI
jgi:multisubunit Na+/H+ antiporter MnhF subunit